MLQEQALTTFQLVLYSALHAITEILPLSGRFHLEVASRLTGWPIPQAPAELVMQSGLVLALLVYFIHDWASIFSSFAAVLVFRKRPMTLDERMVFFLLLSTLPLVAATLYLAPGIEEWSSTNPSMILQFAAGTLLLWFTERMNRKRKSMFDLNLVEALALGAGQVLSILPGVGRATGGIAAMQGRNFNREAGVKYLLLATLPAVLFVSMRLIPATTEAGGAIQALGWLNAGTTFVVSFGTGLFAVNFFVRFFQRNGISGVVAYRTVALVLAPLLIWWSTRG